MSVLIFYAGEQSSSNSKLTEKHGQFARVLILLNPAGVAANYLVTRGFVPGTRWPCLIAGVTSGTAGFICVLKRGYIVPTVLSFFRIALYPRNKIPGVTNLSSAMRINYPSSQRE